MMQEIHFVRALHAAELRDFTRAAHPNRSRIYLRFRGERPHLAALALSAVNHPHAPAVWPEKNT
jgi:hypothetical protein